MELKDALLPVIGAGLGYFAGRESAEGKVVDPENSQELIATLQQRIALMDAKNQASAALVAALKDESETGQLVQAQLQAQIADLNSKLSSQQAAVFANFPVVFGTGDPSLGGWIKGRDGLLISRMLPNFVPGQSGSIATVSGYAANALAQGISVSDVALKAASRQISLGKSMNTSLAVKLSNGLFAGGMAVMLNFAEDVADDPDFIVGLSVYGANAYVGHCIIVPIGRNSLLLLPLGTAQVATDYSVSRWNGQIVRDTVASGVPLPTKAQRESFRAAGGSVFSLSHRTARNLSLRSWSVLANPLAQYMESNVQQNWNDDTLTNTRRSGDVTIVSRMNTGSLPKFYVADVETGGYNAVDLSTTSYM